MKRIFATLASLALAATVVVAHEGNEHVRGTVSAITPQSITVVTAEKATRTLTITPKTAVKQSGKTVKIDAVQVGARVVVDVPEKSTEATLIQVSAAPAAAAPAAAKK